MKSTFVVIIFVFKAAFVLLSRVSQELCRRFLEASWRHSSSGLSLSQFVLFLHVIPDRLMMIRWMNEWMNEWMRHLYSALLCIAVHPKRFTIMWGGLFSTTTSVQHPLGWCDGSHRTTAPVCSPHTSYRWRGERVIEPIKWISKSEISKISLDYYN